MSRAVCDDARLEQGLDQYAEDVRAFGHGFAARFIGEGFDDGTAYPLPVEAKLAVDLLLLLGVDQVEQQVLEAFGRPIFNDFVFLGRETRDRLVGPNLSELMMERFVGHHKLHEALK